MFASELCERGLENLGKTFGEIYRAPMKRILASDPKIWNSIFRAGTPAQKFLAEGLGNREHSKVFGEDGIRESGGA